MTESIDKTAILLGPSGNPTVVRVGSKYRTPSGDIIEVQELSIQESKPGYLRFIVTTKGENETIGTEIEWSGDWSIAHHPFNVSTGNIV